MSNELTAPTTVGVDPINTALVAAGVTSASIEQLAKDYGELAQLTEITSDEQREVVHKAQMAHRDIRVAVVAALKEEREEAVRYQKFVVSEEKRIVGTIEKTELPLKKLKDDWDHKIELKAQEEARQWVEKMNLRKQAAFDIGYYFNGQSYLLDRENGEAPWVLREDQVAGLAMSDEALYALLEAQAAELRMTREIKAEADAKAKEEAEALAAEQRKRDEEAQTKLQEIERREKEMAEKERIAREKQLQEEAAQKAVEAERLRIAQEQEEKEKAQKLLEEQEREKALQASDKEKVLNYGVKVSVLISEIPQLKSAVGTSAMKSYEKNLRDLANSLSKLSQEL